MREIHKAAAKHLLPNKDALETCDIAVFVYDRYDSLQALYYKKEYHSKSPLKRKIKIFGPVSLLGANNSCVNVYYSLLCDLWSR